MDKGRPILILVIPYKGNPSNILECAVDDDELNIVTDKWQEKLDGEGKEIFERKGNILATEIGFVGAFFQDEL